MNQLRYTRGDIKTLMRTGGITVNELAQAFYVSVDRAKDYKTGRKCGQKTLIQIARYAEGRINRHNHTEAAFAWSSPLGG